MNLLIRTFEETLYSLINSVDLPLEVKRIVIENAMIKLEKASDEAIRNEQKGENNGELERDSRQPEE